MTVLKVIRRSAEFLERKGVENPRLQAELLLAHALQMPRMKLYLNFERPVSASELKLLRDWVARRGRREPLQQIVGSTSFCGFEISVNRQVLVPRPETELLAKQGWEFLNSLVAAGIEAPTALDLGTGSGCLAVALAVRCPRAVVWAADASAEALAVAQANATRHGVADRVRFVQSDLFCGLPPGQSFDLIVSNPPYVPTAEIATLTPEVRDFEPRNALDGGPDGLEYFRRIAVAAPGFLRPAGRLMLECGDGQAAAVQAILERQNWVVAATRSDYTGQPRVVIAHRADGSAGSPT